MSEKLHLNDTLTPKLLRAQNVHGSDVCANLVLLECGHQFLQCYVLLLELCVVLKQPGLPELVLLDLLPHPAPLEFQHLVTLESRDKNSTRGVIEGMTKYKLYCSMDD